MSKAFTSGETLSVEAELPMPVGRRPITGQGMAKAQMELKELGERRIPLAAREAEKNDQAANTRLEGLKKRFARLKRIISLSDVVPEPDSEPKKVVLGVRVNLEDVDSGDTLVYVLVGPDEVDVARRYVSYASPVGHALLGLQVGGRAFIKRPKGILEVRVVSIEREQSADRPVKSS